MAHAPLDSACASVSDSVAHSRIMRSILLAKLRSLFANSCSSAQLPLLASRRAFLVALKLLFSLLDYASSSSWTRLRLRESSRASSFLTLPALPGSALAFGAPWFLRFALTLAPLLISARAASSSSSAACLRCLASR